MPLGGRGLQIAAVAAVVIVLLALATAGTRARGADSGHAAPVSERFVDYAYTLWILVLIAIPIILILGRRFASPLLQRQLGGTSGLYRYLAFMALFTMFGYWALHQVDWERLRRQAEDRRIQEFPSGDRPRARPIEAEPRDPAEFQWWVAVVVGSAAAAGGVIYLRRRPVLGAAAREEEDAAESLAAVLDDTLEDLEREADPRRAVIAAYARMERTLAAHGLPRRAFEAPLEYLGRILVELHVRAASAFALTELFERAKFSPHEIDAGMKQEAIAALVAVRDDLRAAQ